VSKKVPLKGNMFQDRTDVKDWVILVPPNACVASVSTNGGFGAESFFKREITHCQANDNRYKLIECI